MKTQLKVFCGILAVALLGLVPPASAQDKDTLTFAIIQTEEMSVLGQRWEGTLKYVSEKIGKKIDFYATTSYASVVQAMLSGFVDIGKLGPKIYLVANEKSGGDIIPVVATGRPPTVFYPEPCACYFGTLATKKGSEFTTIESLKGKVLALVDPGSTSGNALPRALFPDSIGGQSLDEYFGRIFYSGSHSASVRAVHSGKADAGFISESTFARVIESGEVAKDDFNYLWRSPEVPLDVVAVNKKTMSEELINQVRDAFHGMSKTEEGKKLLEATGYFAYTLSDDSKFDPLRKILASK
ncbi:MAG: phosphate/phosphite/phosphonate ABC transporter substrate-binding protein [Rhodospirillales bacterium]